MSQGDTQFSSNRFARYSFASNGVIGNHEVDRSRGADIEPRVVRPCGHLDQLVAVQIAVDGTRPNPGLES